MTKDKDEDEVQDLLDEIEGKESKSPKEEVSAKKKDMTLPPVIVGEVPIKKLKFNKLNRVATEEAVNEIASSISMFGLMIPIVINKKFEILEGERRTRACMKLGYETIPFISSTAHFDEASLVANYIRENLTDEQVHGIMERMYKKESKTQEEIANSVGISQARVSQILGSKKKKPKRKKAKKVKRVALPENVKMDVFKNRVEVTFVLDEEMLKTPEKSIVKLFKEIKGFDNIIAEERA